jgi:hypothetical protein
MYCLSCNLFYREKNERVKKFTMYLLKFFTLMDVIVFNFILLFSVARHKIF